MKHYITATITVPIHIRPSVKIEIIKDGDVLASALSLLNDTPTTAYYNVVSLTCVVFGDTPLEGYRVSARYLWKGSWYALPETDIEIQVN